MKRLALILAIVIGGLTAVPSAHAGAPICDDPLGPQPNICIPSSANSYFARIQQAADYYFSYWRGLGHRASPDFTRSGNVGAQNYSIPHWCRAATPYLWFPWGVVIDDTPGIQFQGRTFVPNLGFYNGAPSIAGYGVTYSGVASGRCRWHWGADQDGTTARNQCVVGIHETGHVMGWSDPGQGDVDLPPIMHAGFGYDAGDLPVADNACERVGL